MTIPGLAVGLVTLAALDRVWVWQRGRRGLPWYRDGCRAAPATGFDELQAMFYASKRHAIEQRRLELVLADHSPRRRAVAGPCRSRCGPSGDHPRRAIRA